MNIKQPFRKLSLERRRKLSFAERSTASTDIQNTLLSLIEQLHLATKPLLVYRSMQDEVDTRNIMNANRKLMFAPVIHGHDNMQWHEINSNTRWKKGAFGVEEPTSGRVWNAEWNKGVLVCPLVGFDRMGNRLGFGAGCFDRWLAQCNQYLLMTIGLAFSCQEVPDIPVETHDVPLDVIITEREMIECRKR